MATAKSAKGNPASHRMGNDKLKARRARSWARGQVRKAENRKANEQRAADNRKLREQGLPTPHEVQRAKRRAKRDEMRAAGLLPPIGTSRAAWEAEKRRKAVA
jgi:hypothetical protein